MTTESVSTPSEEKPDSNTTSSEPTGAPAEQGATTTTATESPGPDGSPDGSPSSQEEVRAENASEPSPEKVADAEPSAEGTPDGAVEASPAGSEDSNAAKEGDGASVDGPDATAGDGPDATAGDGPDATQNGTPDATQTDVPETEDNDPEQPDAGFLRSQQLLESVAEAMSDEMPDGCKPMMITMKNMEKYELKTGSRLKDTVVYKLFEVEDVLEEIRSLGFYSDFNDFKTDLGAYPTGEQVLIVADFKEKYGQNWYICLTVDARDAQMSLIQQEEAKFDAIERAKQEAEAKRLAEEEAIRNAVFDDRPLVPRPYEAPTAPETHDEVLEPMIHPGRLLLRMDISRKRRDFGAVYKFNDRDSDQSGLVEFRQHKDPNFELKRKLVDKCVQACPSWTSVWIPNSSWKKPAPRKGVLLDRHEEIQMEMDQEMMPYTGELPKYQDFATQTNMFRKVNKIMQYEPVELAPDAAADELEGQDMLTFLQDVSPFLESALQQNETVDVFADEFSRLGVDEPVVSNKGQNLLKEVRTFTDLVYSKQKSTPCINWHPKSPNVVAVACTEPISFDERVEQSGIAKSAYVLIWNFSDLIHPQFVLESPYECTFFSFCPDQPHLVVGGCVTGQVVLWDLSDAQDKLLKRQRRGSASHENKAPASEEAESKTGGSGEATEKGVEDGVEDGDSEDAGVITPIKPVGVSAVEQSHRKAVTDIVWVASQFEIAGRGQVSTSTTKRTHQFATCASDSQILFWDLRYREQKKKSNRVSNIDTKSGKKGDDEVTWVPHYKVQLSNREGKRLEVRKICLRGMAQLQVLKDRTPATSEQDRDGASLRDASVFSCTTEDGEIVHADWLAVGDSSSTGVDAGVRQQMVVTGAGESSNKVLWIQRDHFGTCVQLSRSPFFPEILLSVGTYSFNVWLEGKSTTLFESPFSSSHLTCGVWSPTRPGVVIVARADGHIDVWDFTDQSHKPTTTITITSTGIDSMQFRTTTTSNHKAELEDKQDLTATGGGGSAEVSIEKLQLLAIGDDHGNLHVFEVPRDLRRPIPKERTQMRSFWDREIKRLDYVLKRKQLLESLPAGGAGTYGSVKPHGVNGKHDDKASSGAEGEKVPATNADELAVAGEQPHAIVEGQADDVAEEGADSESLEVEEARYRELEEQFVQMMGINRDELHMKLPGGSDSVSSSLLDEAGEDDEEKRDLGDVAEASEKTLSDIPKAQKTGERSVNSENMENNGENKI